MRPVRAVLRALPQAPGWQGDSSQPTLSAKGYVLVFVKGNPLMTAFSRHYHTDGQSTTRQYDIQGSSNAQRARAPSRAESDPGSQYQGSITSDAGETACGARNSNRPNLIIFDFRSSLCRSVLARVDEARRQLRPTQLAPRVPRV